MMIEQNQSRLDGFENANGHREMSHRACLDAEKEKQIPD